MKLLFLFTKNKYKPSFPGTILSFFPSILNCRFILHNQENTVFFQRFKLSKIYRLCNKSDSNCIINTGAMSNTAASV